MSREVVVATMWDHVEQLGVVDEMAPPTQAALDASADALVAANCGARPAVRVVEQLDMPAFADSGEPVCEDIWRWP